MKASDLRHDSSQIPLLQIFNLPKSVLRPENAQKRLSYSQHDVKVPYALLRIVSMRLDGSCRGTMGSGRTAHMLHNYPSDPEGNISFSLYVPGEKSH